MIIGLAGCATMAMAQTNNVTSVVISAETGEPVSGASVVVTGTDIATTTDINGKFSIDAPAEYKTLTISHNNLQPAVMNILPEPIVMREANGLMSGWGVEFGLSAAKWTFEDDDDADVTRTKDVTLGLTYDYSIQSVPNLSILGGLFYTAKGTSMMDGEGTFNANYLELQATAKYSYTLPVLNNDLRAFALAGPYFSYGLFGDIEIDNEYADMGYGSDGDATFDYFKRFDVGMVLGFGVEYKRYSLTCRWGLGFLNIFDNDKFKERMMERDYNDLRDYYTDYDFSWEDFTKMVDSDDYDFEETVKNRTFMLTVGYRF